MKDPTHVRVALQKLRRRQNPDISHRLQASAQGPEDPRRAASGAMDTDRGVAEASVLFGNVTEPPSECCDQTQRLRGLGQDCLARRDPAWRAFIRSDVTVVLCHLRRRYMLYR